MRGLAREHGISDRERVDLDASGEERLDCLPIDSLLGRQVGCELRARGREGTQVTTHGQHHRLGHVGGGGTVEPGELGRNEVDVATTLRGLQSTTDGLTFFNAVS